MVELDIRVRELKDPVLLNVMGKVPRHLFVDAAYRDRVYEDHPLPIGEGQTISQPYVVALMAVSKASPAFGSMISMSSFLPNR